MAARVLMVALLGFYAGFRAEARGGQMPAAPQQPGLASRERPADDDLAALGIRRLAGRYLTLYTDLRPAADVDELTVVFDLAVPQWCGYFGVDPKRLSDWRVTGYLIRDPDLFRRTNLLPASLPPFLHGYQAGRELWWYEQPSAYYRRHLLLHEGTHAFMNRFLGGTGPPWYMEGVAELLGTHKWRDGKLTLRYFPQSREEVEQWGRLKIVRDGRQAGQAPDLLEVMRYGPRAHLRVEPYGWSWAAAVFLDHHPRHQAAFRAQQRDVRDSSLDFSRRLFRQLAPDWPRISLEWQVFLAEADYGYDLERGRIQFRPPRTLPPEGQTVRVAADRGWQSSGLQLETGVRYRLEAEGRYQVANQPKPWWCEPPGVTIHYHAGQPLGALLAAIQRDDVVVSEAGVALLRPVVVGAGRELLCDRSGTLFLRINEAAAGLSDNSGEVSVKVTPLR